MRLIIFYSKHLWLLTSDICVSRDKNKQTKLELFSNLLCYLSVKAHAAMGDLEERVHAVCLKTQSSESIVQEMTRDIKQLDVAKRNLISSLKALHHLQILLTGVYSLGIVCLIGKLFTFKLYSK